MNKRRRTSSVASRGMDDDPEDTQPEPAKRRKKLDPVNNIFLQQLSRQQLLSNINEIEFII